MHLFFEQHSTPTELANLEWKQAPNSVLIVRHGDDHGTFNGA